MAFFIHIAAVRIAVGIIGAGADSKKKPIFVALGFAMEKQGTLRVVGINDGTARRRPCNEGRLDLPDVSPKAENDEPLHAHRTLTLLPSASDLRRL